MAIKSRDFVGIAEGIKSHELSIKGKIEVLEKQISKLSVEQQSLEKNIASLEAALAAAYEDTDEDGYPDYGLIAFLDGQFSSARAELTQVENDLEIADENLEKSELELETILEEKEQTLFEIQERARKTAKNIALAGGMYGAYAGVGNSLQNSMQMSLTALSQAARILDSSVTESSGSAGSPSSTKSMPTISGSGTQSGASSNSLIAFNSSNMGMEYSALSSDASQFSSVQVGNSTLGTLPNFHFKKEIMDMPRPSNYISIQSSNSYVVSTFADVSGKHDELPEAIQYMSQQVPSRLENQISIENVISTPHTFEDFINPDNYNTDGHYTGDYRPPSYGSATAADDFKKWQNNGGLNNNDFIDYRKKGEARTDIVSANDIFDILDSESPDFWTGKWSDMDKYVQMAKHIPLVRKYLNSGKSIEDIVKMKGTVGVCAQYYFKNPITVMKAGDAYIHCNDGRHRTVAAQLAHVEMPVTIVQEYHLNRTGSSQLNPKSQSNNASEIYENPSGSSGSYGSGGGGSQPFAPTYHVVGEMMDRDKQDHNIYDPKSGYFTNPYAISFQNAIRNGRIQMDNHSAHGTYTYVVNENGDVVFGKRFNPNSSNSRAPHPTLIGGKDPQVQCAGMIRIEKGRIVWYNNDSGHFRPNAKSLSTVDAAMEKLRKTHPEIFAKNYKGGSHR